MVALGDSLTWGFGASRRDAWPQAFAERTGLVVYNMGLGGYGPVQYAELLDDALELEPRLVIVAVYFGNDLYDAYRMAYHFPAHARLRSSALLPEQIREQPFGAEIGAAEPVELLSAFDVIARKSSLVRLLERGGCVLGRGRTERYLRGKAWALAHPEQAAWYEAGAVSTVLAPAYRLLALELDDPRIAEGLRISAATIEEIAQRCRAKGVGAAIVLLPTKESVYVDLLPSDRKSPTLLRMVEREALARRRLLEAGSRDGAIRIDLLPRLREDARAEMRLYPVSSDGHPTGLGYRRIAAHLEIELGRRGLAGGHWRWK